MTPTRGNFSEYWLEQLLAVKGDVQFVLVYPPGERRRTVGDPRVKSLTSPYKGEMMQRFIGLLNVDGDFVLALDDDDYVHPDIAESVQTYFDKFPHSLVLRLMQERVPIEQVDDMRRPWQPIPRVETLEVAARRNGNEVPILQEVPIAPLKKHFDWRYLIWPFMSRTDDCGPHIENFNNKVWRNDRLQQVLPDLAKTTILWGVLTWIPRSGFDRLMGLYLQGYYYYRCSRVVGHWMPEPAQIRFTLVDPAQKPPRFHVLSDVLLIKRFPQYGYFWNLFFNKLSYVPRIFAKMLRQKTKR
ncbi:MAG TPA: glycosyltransferase family A protein [Trichocoleus sp.]